MQSISFARPLLTVILSLFLVFLSNGQKKVPVIYYPPPGSWEHRSPSAVGMDSLLLQEAVQFARDNESKEPRDLKEAHYLSAFGREPFGYPVGPMKERGPASGLVIRNGYIITEWGDP